MNTYTPNAKLAMPAVGDVNWNIPINGNAARLDALAPVGGLAVTTAEVPSGSLNVAVAAGSYVKQDGTIGTYAGTSGRPIPAGTTQVLYLDLTAAGILVVASSFPATPHVRLATATAGSTTITAIVDARQCFPVVGSWADGVNIGLGTATGSQIGTSPSQRLGFFGKTPTTQPTMGAATAGSSYTAAEQAMINTLWSVLRTLGLGS